MVMALPKDIPTLHVQATGNWTRPDNVRRSDSPTDFTIKCDVDPARRPSLTDHLPIITIDLQRTVFTPRRNFKGTDWTKFREKLQEKMNRNPCDTHPLTATDLDILLNSILDPVSKVIQEIIPMTKPSPHMKRWWSRELTIARKIKNRLSNQSYKWQGLPTHPVHAEHKQASREYAELLSKSQNEGWHQWLNDISTSDLWRASKFVNTPATDGGVQPP
jgi:hypothetical protein